MKLTRVRFRDPKTGRYRYKVLRSEPNKQRKTFKARLPIHTSNDELNEIAAANLLGLKVQTLRNRRSQGLPPPYFKKGRSVFYRLSDLREYDAARTRNGTIF